MAIETRTTIFPTTQPNAQSLPRIIESDATGDLEDTGLVFRRQYYVIAIVAVGLPLTQPLSAYIDTGVTMSLIDRTFLLRCIPFVKIQSTASAIKVYGITGSYLANKYYNLDLYFPGQIEKQPCIAYVRHEVHIVETLKANMLIGVDILGL